MPSVNRGPRPKNTPASISHNISTLAQVDVKPKSPPSIPPKSSSPHQAHPTTLSLNSLLVTLFLFRSLSALFSPIMDCDETFNYIEPLHNLIYQYGLETWEYNPAFALRSYPFLLLHYCLSFVSYFIGVDWAYGKAGQIMLLRLLLGLFSCYCQAVFIRAIGLYAGEKSARFLLFALLFATGFTHASHSILPQGLCMNLLLLVSTHWINALNILTLFPHLKPTKTKTIPTQLQIQLQQQQQQQQQQSSQYSKLNFFYYFPAFLDPLKTVRDGKKDKSYTFLAHHPSSPPPMLQVVPETPPNHSQPPTTPPALSDHTFELYLKHQAFISQFQLYSLQTNTSNPSNPSNTSTALPDTGDSIPVNDIFINNMIFTTSSFTSHPNIPSPSFSHIFRAIIPFCSVPNAFPTTSAPSQVSPSTPPTPPTTPPPTPPTTTHAESLSSPESSTTPLLPQCLPSPIPSSQIPAQTKSPQLTSSPSQPNQPNQPNQPSQDQSVELYFYCIELHAIRQWSLMIQYTIICGLFGWPFTLIFLIPIIYSFFDCYLHISNRLSYLLSSIREHIFHTFSTFFPFFGLKALLVTGNPSHPQWLVELFFFQLRPVFSSFDFIFQTTAKMNLFPHLTHHPHQQALISSLNLQPTPPNTPPGNTKSENDPFTNISAFSTVPFHITPNSFTRWKIFSFLVLFSLIYAIFIAAIGVAIDGYYYNRFTLTFLNIALYNSNFFSNGNDASQGQQLYGVEPPLFYFSNLILNFNLGFIFALFFILIGSIVVILNCLVGKYRLTNLVVTFFPIYSEHSPDPITFVDPSPQSSSTTITTNQSTLLNSIVPKSLHPPLFYRIYAVFSRIESQMLLLSPAIIWFLVMLAQPHKEERFLYIIYPLIALSITFGLELSIDILDSINQLVFSRCKQRPNKRQSTPISQHFTNILNYFKISSLSTQCSSAAVTPAAQLAQQQHNRDINDLLTFGLVSQCSCCQLDLPPILTTTSPSPPPIPSSQLMRSPTNPSATTLPLNSSTEPPITSPPITSSVLETVQRVLNNSLSIPTASLASFRYQSLSHPIRRPYRRYTGVLYIFVLLVTCFFMTLSVSRNLALLFGYSTPGMTMFKFYAAITSDSPVTPVLPSTPTSPSSLLKTAPSGTLQAISIVDQVDALFTAKLNNFQPIMHSYVLPMSLVQQPSNSSQPNTQTEQQPPDPLIAEGNRGQFAQISAKNRLAPKEIHPCFIKQLYFHSQVKQRLQYNIKVAKVTGTKNKEPINEPSRTDDLDASELIDLTINRHFEGVDPLAFHQLDYFPSMVAECMLTYQNPSPAPLSTDIEQTKGHNSTSTPTPSFFLPINSNNHLGSQPINFQLHSLLHAANGFFIKQSPPPTTGAQLPLDPPIPRSIISNIEITSTYTRPAIDLHPINKETNPYSAIHPSSSLISVIPIDTRVQSHKTIKRIVEEATTVKLCIGNDWYRYFSSFFLPEAHWVNVGNIFSHLVSDSNNDFQHLAQLFEKGANLNSTGSHSYNKPSAQKSGLFAVDSALDFFSHMFNKHIPGTGVGTIVGEEILLRPRFDIAYLPESYFPFDGMLPQPFASSLFHHSFKDSSGYFPSQSPNPLHFDVNFLNDCHTDSHCDKSNHSSGKVDPPSQFPFPWTNGQTGQRAPNFNDLNQGDSSRRVPSIQWCEYVIDSDLRARNQHSTEQLSDKSDFFDPYDELSQFFDLVHTAPLIDPERSPSSSRAFYILGRWNDRNKFLPFTLWKKK